MQYAENMLPIWTLYPLLTHQEDINNARGCASIMHQPSSNRVAERCLEDIHRRIRNPCSPRLADRTSCRYGRDCKNHLYFQPSSLGFLYRQTLPSIRETVIIPLEDDEGGKYFFAINKKVVSLQFKKIEEQRRIQRRQTICM